MSLRDLMQSPANFLRRFRSQSIEVLATSYRRPSVFDKSKLIRTLPQSPASVYTDAANAMSKEDELAELNSSLQMLASMFPNVQYEVFREMLSSFSGRSRLQIVTEQLLRHRDKYVNGRWRIPTTEQGQRPQVTSDDKTPLAVGDAFRSESYKGAVRRALCIEFRGLSGSSVDAVLAERNYCYTLCRPMLQNIAAKSWRNNISTFFSRWRKPAIDASKSHFMLVWVRNQQQMDLSEPTLKRTGDAELDQELFNTILEPLISEAKEQQRADDWHLALNNQAKEAEHAGAIYECECCFSETTFEQMSACTDGGHILCFRCVRNAVNEALFGQSWGQNIDHERGQLRCLAPMAEENCVGCVPESTVERAVCQEKGGRKVWRKLESRLAQEDLLRAQVPLVQCPFCPYAECDELYLPPSVVQYKLNTSEPLTVLILLILFLDLLPPLILYSLIYHWIPSLELRQLSSFVNVSLTKLTRSKHLSRRFRCRSPACGNTSCLSCSKAWQDPHICHESATLSLRKTIEAARTAALKRTCPRCGLGFVKESGCNKLTCVCGYVMCYICRQGLGRSAGNQGYEHFCQHFRPAGGKCVACEKCDLYAGEDEAGAVARAGQLAEREWREREGMIGVEGIGGGQHEGALAKWRQDEWTLQDVVNWCVAKVVVC